MKIAGKDYIINTVFRTNILPLISECNTSCVFCSHKQNPHEVEVFRLPKLSLGDIEDLLDFLSPNKKIVIGEAATRIIEGEPLLHKNFLEIVTLIRKKFKFTPIQITTNGILLNAELVNSLVELGNIELNISVNCVKEEKRRKILGIKNCGNISEKVQLLRDRIRFTGSMVYVPEIMDTEDVEEVISLLDSSGADTVRVFLPGVSAMAEKVPDFLSLYKEMKISLNSVREKYSIPVVVEPAIIDNLDCSIEGIIRNSPAWSAGMRAEDVIVEINGEKINSRVDAFNKAFRAANPMIGLLRGGEDLEVKLRKAKNTSPGFVVLYDIDTDVIDQIKRVVERNLMSKETNINSLTAKKVWFLTSELAINILKSLFNLDDLNFEYDIISVKNRYFGGTIMCAGLMTVQDVMSTLRQELQRKEKPDLIILPSIMFDFKNRDLLGRNMKEIEDELRIPVDTV